AARSDAVLGKEFQEIGEELVDASGGGEFFDVGGEFLVEVERGVGGWLEMSVSAAEESRFRG
ncbi:MAG: hypothetical protein WBE97_01965, partial [Candidatus Acidiferrales bacterium]